MTVIIVKTNFNHRFERIYLYGDFYDSAEFQSQFDKTIIIDV